VNELVIWRQINYDNA